MGSGPETRFVRRLREIVERAGGMSFKAHGSKYTPAGWPDLWIGHPAWSGWIEAKTDDGRLSPLQVVTLRRLRERGTPAGVLRSADVPRGATWDDVLDALERVSQSSLG